MPETASGRVHNCLTRLIFEGFIIKSAFITVLDDNNVEIIGLSSIFYDNLRIDLAVKFESNTFLNLWLKVEIFILELNLCQHIACSGNKRNSIALELE